MKFLQVFGAVLIVMAVWQPVTSNEDFLQQLKKFNQQVKVWVAKYGPEAKDFFECCGQDLIHKCTPQLVKCVKESNPPACLEGSKCYSEKVTPCVKNLQEKHKKLQSLGKLSASPSASVSQHDKDYDIDIGFQPKRDEIYY